MYEWRDPAQDAEDARFVKSCRESLVIERGAYDVASRERAALYGKLLEIRELLDVYEGREGPGARHPAPE